MGLGFPDIAEALALGPQGERSDYDLNPDTPRVAQRRPAAVLCGIVPRPWGLSVILTRRAAHLRRHAGQIAFPGGRVDPGDPSPMAAALREAEEEVGMILEQVDMLGILDPYHTVTGFAVTPFVARIDPRWHPIPDPGEVAEAFEVPFDFLMDPANHRRESYLRDGQKRHFWAMPWGEYHIWGATAGILRGLSERLIRAGRIGATR